MESINSLHIVFSKVYSLLEIPFNTSGVKFNKAFKDYFNEPDCFKLYRSSIEELWKDESYTSEMNEKLYYKPDQPFIKDLGLLYLDVNKYLPFNNSTNYHKRQLASAFAEGPGAKRNAISQELSDYEDFYLIGYDTEVQDQRYSMLYLELYKPMFISAKTDGKTIAQGKLNIHLFPNGTLTLLADIAVINRDISHVTEFAEIVRTLRPTRHNKTGWESKLANGSLLQLFDACRNKVISSVFKEPYNKIKSSDLYTAIAANTDMRVSSLAEKLLKSEPRVFPFKRYEFEEVSEEMAISSRMLIWQLNCERKQRRDSRVFRNIYRLFEQTYYTRFIWEMYYNYLNDEVVSLQQCRMNDSVSKIAQKKLWQFNMFNKHILIYLHTIEKIIGNYDPFMEKLVDEFRIGMHFDKIKTDTDRKIREWDKELNQWKSGYSYVAKYLLGPLKKMLLNI